MANLKNIADLPVAESVENLNLIVNENGSAKQIASSAVGAQADWTETNENSPAFIKNKPTSGIEIANAEIGQIIVVKAVDENGVPTEWECANRACWEESNMTLILPETTWTFNDTGYSGMQQVCDELNLVDGEKYMVVWDGVKYNCVCFGYSGEAIGNFSAIGGPSNNEPFGIWSSGNVFVYETGTHTFSIYKDETTVHKLDKKYLPDGIISAQADWNENDETSAAYIQNRPFYTENESVTVQEETTITLNEKGTGYYDGSWYPNEGLVYTVVWDGIEYISELAYNDSDACSRFNVMIDGERVNFYEGNTIYGTPAMAGEHTFKVLEIQETVHKVDLKYLPDIPTKMDSHNAVCRNSFCMLTSKATSSASHAIGEYTTASGRRSHAEGYYTTASGPDSHAEGSHTTASGDHSHAEGNDTTASNSSSHAEGNHTTASGFNSHAEGSNTVAQRANQHVQGQFNILDTDGPYVTSHGKYLHIVGNGISDTSRSNAHTLDWDGNAWFAGYVEGNAVILPSSTEGSTKRFRITVDDSGVLTATEVL